VSFYIRATGVALCFLAASTVLAQKADRLPNFDVRSQLDAAQVRGLTEAIAAKRASLEPKLALVAAEASGPLRLTTNGSGGLRTLGARGGFLTGLDDRDGLTIARDYLAAHAGLLGFSGAQAAALRSVSRRATDSFEVMTFEQRVGDVPVYGGRVRVAVASNGRILQLEAGDVESSLLLGAPATVSASEAVVRAFDSAGFGEAMEAAGAEVAPLGRAIPGWDLYASPLGMDAPPTPVRRTIFPMGTGLGRHAWVVHVTGPRSATEVVVAADDGQLLLRVELTAEVGRGTYWEQSPEDGDQVSRDFPEGWLPVGRTVTTGNNTDAFLDRDDDDRPDPVDGGGLRNGRAFSDSQDFTFPGGDGLRDHFDTGASSVLHAWVFANKAHDYFYELGFDEAAGNFQTDNFGRGGEGEDPVVMNIQDIGTINNAFFSTAPEGVSPLTAYGLFFDPEDLFEEEDPEVRDSALDGTVVFHEFTHGVTTRVVGGSDRVNCLFTFQAGSLGEGWSDYFAASFYDDPVMGAYSTGDPFRGIRRHPYDNTPVTLADYGNTNFSSPHPDGEIWAAALWDLRTAVGAETADALIYGALELTPCNPTYVDARDALLVADQAMNAGANRAAIWGALAPRGMGFSAEGANFNGVFSTLVSAAFDLPSDLGGDNGPPRITSRPTDVAFLGAEVQYRVNALDPDGDAVTIEPVGLPEGAVWNAEQSTLTWNANFTGRRFVFRATDARGASTTQIFFYLSGALLTLGSPVEIDGDLGESGQLQVMVPEGVQFLQFTLRGAGGDPDLIIFPPEGPFELSFGFEANETLTFVNPPAGRWSGLVEAFEDYRGVQLLAQAVTPEVLTLPGSSGLVGGPEGAQFLFQVNVPDSPAPAQGAPALLRVQTRGFNGDADLFVARDLLGSCESGLVDDCDFDGSSESFSSLEVVEIEDPTSGDYFVLVEAFEGFDGLIVDVGTRTTDAEPTAATEGADFAERLAPGGISTLFGSGFTDGVSVEASTLPLPTELGGVQVIVDGVPAGLFFVSPRQVNFQNPFEPGVGFTDVVLLRDGLVSDVVSVLTFPDVPRLFGFLDGEVRLPVVVHASDNTVVTAANPARPGETLVAFLTGVGSLENPPASRQAALGDPLTRTTDVPVVTVGGRRAATLFSGWTPGFVGLVQVNFTLDPTTPFGGFAQFQMDFGGRSTQTLGLPIGAP